MPDNSSAILNFAKIKDFQKYKADISGDLYFGFPIKGIIEAEDALLKDETRAIAYFSMEYGLATNIYNVFTSCQPVSRANRLSENEVFSNARVVDYLFNLNIDVPLDLPIYSGGLGVLAGDTIKTMADFRIPACAVGILWNKGYFKQRFWFKFGQLPEEMRWDPATFAGLIPLEDKVKLELKDRDIYLRIWKYYVFNRTRDFAIPLILLDSNVEENDEPARKLTDRLYKSDDVDGRLLQRLILGMGGMKAIETLKYRISIHHLNEGHAAFAFVQKASRLKPKEREQAKLQFAYTCHTPVPAGHDRFQLSELERTLIPSDLEVVKRYGLEDGKDGTVNLTTLAMNTSYSINAVSKKHGKIMQVQFPAYKDKIRSVTNGIHLPTWMSTSIMQVLNDFLKPSGDLLSDPGALKEVLRLKDDEAFRRALFAAHMQNKKTLAQLLHQWKFRDDCLTIAWARRIAAYKRPRLIFQDLERLTQLAKTIGPIQILYAGKAHPNDNMAFTYVNEIMNTIDKAGEAKECLKIVMLENYDIYFAKLLVSSVDIWLNNPLPPYEASGTSGMKAIANGVVQLSTVDGWVEEACDKMIGRFFGYRDDGKAFSDNLTLRLEDDSAALYASLEELMRIYYDTVRKGDLDVHSPWIDMMINCIAEAANFNTSRMVKEYRTEIWKV